MFWLRCQISVIYLFSWTETCFSVWWTVGSTNFWLVGWNSGLNVWIQFTCWINIIIICSFWQISKLKLCLWHMSRYVWQCRAATLPDGQRRAGFTSSNWKKVSENSWWPRTQPEDRPQMFLFFIVVLRKAFKEREMTSLSFSLFRSRSCSCKKSPLTQTQALFLLWWNQ